MMAVKEVTTKKLAENRVTKTKQWMKIIEIYKIETDISTMVRIKMDTIK